MPPIVESFAVVQASPEALVELVTNFNRDVPVGTLVEYWHLPDWSPHFAARPARGFTRGRAAVIANTTGERCAITAINRCATAAVEILPASSAAEIDGPDPLAGIYVPLRHVRVVRPEGP